MKKIFLTLSTFALLQIAANAQAPAGFNYQGIARTSSGAPMASKPLGMRISIHDGTAAGTIVYQETQTTTTNPYGLYNVTIGGGAAVTGTLAGVNWASGAKFIQVELDANGGTSYTDLGTSQLQSVPYAMAASSASANLTLTGNTLSAGGTTVTLPAGTTYTAGTGIAISGTNAISVSNLNGDVTGAPNATTVGKIQGTSVSAAAPTSGQVLKYTGTAWAGGTDNDAQTLSISGNTLSISGSASSVTLPAAPTYTGGTGITVTGTSIAANNLGGDVTGAPGANTVTKIQGTSVATGAPASGQILKYNGTAYAPAADLGVTSTATTNYLPKVSGTNTEVNSAIYDNNGRIAINHTNPLLDFDMVGDSLGIRTNGTSSSWDNLWFHVDGTRASINASGAEDGMLIRVGSNTTGSYTSTSQNLIDTVMSLVPSNGGATPRVGVNTIAPKSTLDVMGSMGLPIVTIQANYTVTAADYTILCRAQLTPYTITLPSASGVTGRIYVVRRAPLLAANTSATITVTSASGINGPSGSTTSYIMNGNNAITLQSDGSSWYAISLF